MRSLTAYLAYVTAPDEDARKTALENHFESIKKHVKELSEKNYQVVYGLKSTDFVLMFMPIESALSLAVTNDPDLLGDAWQKNVMLVNPSTLLFALRMVAHFWTQDRQKKN